MGWGQDVGRHLKAWLQVEDLLSRRPTHMAAGRSPRFPTMCLSLGLLECPPDMVAGLPQSERSERARQKWRYRFWPPSEVKLCLVSYLLHESALCTDVNTRKYELPGATLKAGHHDSTAHLTEPAWGFVCTATARKTINWRVHLLRVKAAAAKKSCKRDSMRSTRGARWKLHRSEASRALCCPIWRYDVETIRKVPDSAAVTDGAHLREASSFH